MKTDMQKGNMINKKYNGKVIHMKGKIRRKRKSIKRKRKI